MLRAATTLLTVLLAGCTYLTGDSHVVVTSTPAGAEILVDGLRTEFTTPAKIELDAMNGDDHRITLRKQGFDDETRTAYHYTSGYTSRWIDGASDVSIWSCFLWWTFGDMVTPFAIEWQYVPHELHVVLYPPGEGPVTTPPAGDSQ